jgi:hypothetical protein
MRPLRASVVTQVLRRRLRRFLAKGLRQTRSAGLPGSITLGLPREASGDRSRVEAAAITSTG